MAEIWPVNLTPEDKRIVVKLAQRRKDLGLSHSFTETIRTSVRLAQTASDEQLVKGEA
jgi:hypothetical protein